MNRKEVILGGGAGGLTSKLLSANAGIAVILCSSWTLALGAVVGVEPFFSQ